MDRVRDYLDRLEIQDPRHELAKNPTVVPSDWDRNRFRPVVRRLNRTEMTSRVFLGRGPPSRTLPLPTALRRDPLARGPFNFPPDTESSALSRENSSSTYSSVFSEGGRSTSTAPSSYKDTPEEFEDHAPTIHVVGQPRPPRRFGRVRGVGRARRLTGGQFSGADALFEEDVVIKESREVIITKPNPQRASLDEREVPYERGQCIIHDLKEEERHQRQEKQRKGRLHEAEKAEELEKERQADAAMHEWLMEFHSISHTTDTSSKSGPDTNQAAGSPTAQMIEACSRKLSKIFSQTDSDISEDATDWEEDSDDDSVLPHDHEEELELESSLVQNYLMPMKLQVIERLMANFLNIFNDCWSVGIRQLGSASDGSNQSTASTTSESRSSSQSSSRAWGGKRSRSDDREDDETGDRPGRRRKQLGKLPAVQEVEVDVKRQFACPFRKRNPWKYSVQEWPRCALKPQKTIARLKAHLYQYHPLHQCLRCKAVFDSEELLDAHTVAEERCNLNAEEPVDGVTRKMKDQLQCRKKLHPGQTDAEKWEAIYKVLFPDEVVPDPYFEPVPDHNVQGQRRQSPDSVSLSEYESYLRRVLPHFVRNDLEEALSSELEPIETQLQSRMMEIVQEATNKALHSFRNMRRSDSQVRSTSELDTDLTATSSAHQHTSTEIFFELPPPVNFSGNENYLAQPKSRNNSSSDSGYASRPSLSNSSNSASSDRIEREVAFSSDVDEEPPQSGPENTAPFNFSQLCDLGEVVDSGALCSMDLPGDIYQPENTRTAASVPAPPSIHTSTQNQQINDNLFLGDIWFENTESGEMADLDLIPAWMFGSET
ncbi:hypothetical protein OIDMADRAFT_146920 [Oidiodendron maius Zn]|uniref:C2H2-type domain-containing protein n=1 Tax=Oidiodendron maius (strain Zn) TaxID=913774 RepID=A0A0C3H4L0_OIDMZ|nr:hypothetical protein OIDMADRAFT_146920 [Oidiodendron maius Zn]